MTSRGPVDRTVESADGTPIAVESTGAGATPLVVIHGSLADGSAWRRFAAELGDIATVHVMTRRGRGASSDAGRPYAIDREWEDVAAVRALAGPDAVVLAHSFGAFVALGQALQDPPRALVVYEPPLSTGDPVAGEALAEFETAVDEGRLDDALAFGAVHFVGVPEEMIEPMRGSEGWSTLAALTPTWGRELREIDAAERDLSRFAVLAMPVLALVGEVSPPWLVQATLGLAEVLPLARVKRLPGQGHGANEEAPVLLAAAVRVFLDEVGPGEGRPGRKVSVQPARGSRSASAI